jgi:hypothetical protein
MEKVFFRAFFEEMDWMDGGEPTERAPSAFLGKRVWGSALVSGTGYIGSLMG